MWLTVACALSRGLLQELDQERDALKHRQKELRYQHKGMQVCMRRGQKLSLTSDAILADTVRGGLRAPTPRESLPALPGQQLSQ